MDSIACGGFSNQNMDRFLVRKWIARILPVSGCDALIGVSFFTYVSDRNVHPATGQLPVNRVERRNASKTGGTNGELLQDAFVEMASRYSTATQTAISSCWGHRLLTLQCKQRKRNATQRYQ